jgi:hypothetical protein
MFGPRCPGEATAADPWLFRKLRQHDWEPYQESYGHDGGHYGAYQQSFLRTHVLPLLRIPDG